jgi:hypothetical protein
VHRFRIDGRGFFDVACRAGQNVAVMSPQAVLANTHWAALAHAYADASALPDELIGLLSEDPDAVGQVLATLDAAVLHQGTIYSATAPAALYVAGIIGDPRTLTPCASALPWNERSRPLRAALLEWLGNVADSATWGEGGHERPDAAVAACRAIRLDLYQVVALFVEDADESVRTAATGAAGNLLCAPELADFRPAAADRLLTQARHRPPHERANTALAVAQWGAAPHELLSDPDHAVRVYAALAPALDGDPAARNLVQRALLDPAAADAWFTGHETLLCGRLRFALVQTLLRRTATFAEILPQALAVAHMTNGFTVDVDWGPLLLRAFPRPHVPGTPPSWHQRAFLAALLDNDGCWGVSGNAIPWFARAGLPHGREALRGLLGTRQGRAER